VPKGTRDRTTINIGIRELTIADNHSAGRPDKPIGIKPTNEERADFTWVVGPVSRGWLCASPTAES
jgi:hypothetical protein